MPTALRALLNRLDGASERLLLWTNLGLAAFVVLSHGGALAITYAKATPEADAIRSIAALTLPIATLVILTAAAALIRADWRRLVLAIHGSALAVSAIALLLWAAGIVLRGIPQGNFSWGVGLMTAWVAYSFFVLSRYSLPSGLRNRAAFFYAPAAALVVALPVDIGVFVRLIAEMGERFGH